MKKFFLFASALLASASMMAHDERRVLTSDDAVVAAFEDVEAGIDDSWEAGVNTWTSGEYTFTTYKDDAWGTPYYYSFVVSDETETTSTGYAEPYRSISGGAHSGNNFAVWFSDWNGNNSITFASQVVPGMFVNNNAYTVGGITTDDFKPARKFTAQDTLTLVLDGKLEGELVGSIPVYLAVDGKYIADWTYVSLAELGQIDELQLSMVTTDTGDYGANTPTYVCIDDFGATLPIDYVAPEMAVIPMETGLEEVEVAGIKITKFLHDGQLLIKRDGQLFNVQGIRVK